MTIKKIAILVHERHRDAKKIPYRIWAFRKIWKRQGIEVELVRGIRRAIDADLLIPHLDLSWIPDDYWAFIQRHENVVNRAVRDIRKTNVSRQLVARGDAWDGPVVVKTNANCRGILEGKLLRGKSANADGLLARASRWSWVERLRLGSVAHLERYYLFRSVRHVPAGAFENPALVVERFLPEERNGEFVVRTWTVFGDRAQGREWRSRDPFVKAQGAVKGERVPPHPQIEDARRRLGLDYAKLDYVVRDGAAILFDVSLTPGMSGRITEGRIGRCAELAAGLSWFETRR